MRRLYRNFRWWRDGSLQSMLVENERVVARGPSVEQPGDEMIDLAGRTVMPGFVDAHCHILPTGLQLQMLDLTGVSSKEEVFERILQRHRELPDGAWLLATQYDQNRFPTGEHLTRDELDAVCSARPILLRHSNGHASVCNSAALQAAGVDESVADPEGGRFRRDGNGRLDGVLLENASELVTAATPDPHLEDMVNAILSAGERMAELGITCASDMMTGRYDLLMELAAYRIAAERGLKIRTRLYLQWGTVFGPRRVDGAELSAAVEALDGENCRVAGIKIFADGAIGSATAAIYGEYESAEINRAMILSKRGRATTREETSGQLMYAPEKLTEMVRIADEAGYPVAIHCIGDYATDLVLDAYETVPDPSRHRLEHAMLLSDAQIERIARLGCPVTFQPEFLLRFQHGYRRQLGEERAARLKRARSVIDAGIPLSFNSDRPIVPGDPWDGIRTAVRRPDGYDPSENVSMEEAILAYTVEGARVNDDTSYGSLEPGEWADFQVYGSDPLQFGNPELVSTVRGNLETLPAKAALIGNAP